METFLRNDWEVQMEGYKWFGVGRTGGGKASGGVGMLVLESLRPRVEMEQCCEWSAMEVEER